MVVPAPTAFLLDFNGTLSDDEALLFELLAEVTARAGRPLDWGEYHTRFAGHTDAAILRAWLGDRDDIAELVCDRVDAYIARAGDGHTIHPDAATAVWMLAAAGSVAIVSNAYRREITVVLAGAGLEDAVTAIIARDDVSSPKPSAQPYLAALGVLGAAPEEAVAFEDTATGLAAAAAAGVPCVAIRGTMPDHLLRPRLTIANGIDRALVRRLLGTPPPRRPVAAARRLSTATPLGDDPTAG